MVILKDLVSELSKENDVEYKISAEFRLTQESNLGNFFESIGCIAKYDVLNIYEIELDKLKNSNYTNSSIYKKTPKFSKEGARKRKRAQQVLPENDEYTYDMVEKLEQYNISKDNPISKEIMTRVIANRIDTRSFKIFTPGYMVDKNGEPAS